MMRSSEVILANSKETPWATDFLIKRADAITQIMKGIVARSEMMGTRKAPIKLCVSAGRKRRKSATTLLLRDRLPLASNRARRERPAI